LRVIARNINFDNCIYDEVFEGNSIHRMHLFSLFKFYNDLILLLSF